ncbi:transcriptional regulator [Erwinia billingiae]|uniref:helix-turn-helix domain-containing protein n=1 Tax=Erwinia billingiae TaxID=182337 RepID=UPI0019CF9BF1|nr:helix-turn-helix transcriptional regulator [Erwinia billingiae]MBN7123285.1 transcriptional regulator [Erwinia billingiae]
MAQKTAPLLPHTQKLLAGLGERLKMARLRRKLTAKQVAERAGMTAVTLRSLESGSAGVTIGAWLSVMQVLGLENDLAKMIADDELGRQLQDARLMGEKTVRARKPIQTDKIERRNRTKAAMVKSDELIATFDNSSAKEPASPEYKSVQNKGLREPAAVGKTATELVALLKPVNKKDED